MEENFRRETANRSAVDSYSKRPKPNELRYPVYYEKSKSGSGWRWSWRYGDFDYELLPDVSEVVAWMEMPEPCQVEEE